MGGTIAVDSAPGQGTTFSITAPIPEAGLPEKVSLDDVRADPSRAARVLVVDDEEAVRRIAGATLSRAGHEPVLAADAEEALGLLAGQPIDLMITDLEMPGMNGLELAQRARATYPDLGVLFISGYPDRVLSTASEAVEAIDLLEKPFSPINLLERVARALAYT